MSERERWSKKHCRAVWEEQRVEHYGVLKDLYLAKDEFCKSLTRFVQGAKGTDEDREAIARFSNSFNRRLSRCGYFKRESERKTQAVTPKPNHGEKP